MIVHLNDSQHNLTCMRCNLQSFVIWYICMLRYKYIKDLIIVIHTYAGEASVASQFTWHLV